MDGMATNATAQTHAESFKVKAGNGKMYVWLDLIGMLARVATEVFANCFAARHLGANVYVYVYVYVCVCLCVCVCLWGLVGIGMVWVCP